MKNNSALTPLLGLLCALAMPAWAAEPHVHGGDILPELEGAQLVFHTEGLELDFASGAPLYESDFGGGLDGDFVTDEPGFDHEDGQFTPGTLFAVIAVDTLRFWDGVSWSGATTAVISIEDALPGRPGLDIDGALAAGGAALVGQADASGNFHAHRDFAITNGAAAGSYLITLKLIALVEGALSGDTLDLTQRVYQDSDPFMLVFNRGLEFEAFEASVEARVVPVPAPLMLLGSGLAVLVTARRGVSRRHA